MDPNTSRNLFPMWHFVGILRRVTRKLQVIYKCCTYWMTALLSVISIFSIRAGCQIPLASYGSKHSLQFLFDEQFVCACTHNLKMDVQRIEWLLYYQTHSLCDLKLQERSNWRAMAPDTHWSFSDTKFYAYNASLYITSLYGAQLCMAKNSHILWQYTTHQMTAFLAMMHHFIRTKLASYTTCCSVFSLIGVH